MFRVTRGALKHLPAGSSIIDTTSVQAYEPSPTLPGYATTKAGQRLDHGARAAAGREGHPRRRGGARPPIWTPLQPESSDVLGETLDVNGGSPTP